MRRNRPIRMIPVFAALLGAGIIARSETTPPLVLPIHAVSCHAVALPANVFVRFLVAQPDADVQIAVRGPDGRVVVSTDSSDYGDESASLATQSTGTYSVCVSRTPSSPRQSSRYRLRWDAPRAPSDLDYTRIQAEQQATESRQLLRAGPAEARRALVLAVAAADAMDRIGDARGQVALWIQAGDSCLAAGDASLAQTWYRRALDASPSGEVRARAEATTNLAIAALRLGDSNSAGIELAAAIPMWQASGNRFGLAAAENASGLLATNTGHTQEAIQHYLAAASSMHTLDRRSEAVVFVNIALVLRTVGRLPEAETYLRRALQMLSDPVQIARARVNLARVLAFEGRFPESLELLSVSLPRLRGTQWEGDIENNLGQILLRQNHLLPAIRHLEAGVELARRRANPRILASALHWKGKALAAQESPEALSVLCEAIAIEKANQLDDALASTLLELARTQRRLGRLDDAIASLQEAVRLGDELRVQVAAPDLRSTAAFLREELFEEWSDLLMEMGSPLRALCVADRARAQAVEGAAAALRSEGAADPAAGLRARQRALLATLSFKAREMSDLTDDQAGRKRRSQLLSEVDDLELRYRELDGEAAVLDPRDEKAPVLTEAALKQSFEHWGDVTVIEYLLGEKRSWVWILTAAGVKIHALSGRESIERAADPVIRYGGDRSARLMNPGLERAFRASVSKLARMVLPPELASIKASTRVVVIADGILGRVPFSVLPDQSSTRPIGLKYKLLNTSSLALLVAKEPQRRARRPSPTIAVFADPLLGQSGPARLPFSLREAAYVSQEMRSKFQVKVHTGTEADKVRLLSEIAANPSILHLASHARLDPSRAELSGIYLSSGFLATQELIGYHLGMDLVVLSACSTARGNPYSEASGAVSFGKAVLMAGARSVLSSLWRVDDEGTSLFMKAFYHSLGESRDMDPVEALAAARKTLFDSERWKDPAYWSGWVLEADSGIVHGEGISH